MGMYEKVRETASEIVVFIARNVVERLLGFLLIPLYTRTFAPEEYGVLILLLAAEGFLSQVLNFGVTTSFFRSYYDDDREESRRLATSTAAWFIVGANLVFLALTLPIAPFLGRALFDEPHTTLVQLALVLTTLDALNYLPFVMLKAKQRSKLFVAVSWIATVVQFATIIAFVVGLKMGLLGALLGMVIGAGTRTVMYTVVLRDQIGLQFSTTVLRPLLWLGVPVVFNSVATLVLRISDRFFIHKYFGTGDVALYQLADQFGAILPLLLSNPFSVVWPAMRYKVMKDEDANEYYALVLTYLVFGSLFLGVGIAALAPDVIRIVADERYAGAAAIVPFFVVYYVLAATAKGINVGLMLEKQAHWSAIVVVVSASLNLLLNWLMIPRWGMYGAAWATILSFAFMNWFRWYMSQRYHPVAYEWRRLLKLTGVAALLYAVAMAIQIHNPYVSFATRFAVALLFPVLLLPLGFYDARERARFAGLWNTLRARVSPQS